MILTWRFQILNSRESGTYWPIHHKGSNASLHATDYCAQRKSAARPWPKHSAGDQSIFQSLLKLPAETEREATWTFSKCLTPNLVSIYSVLGKPQTSWFYWREGNWGQRSGALVWRYTIGRYHTSACLSGHLPRLLLKLRGQMIRPRAEKRPRRSASQPGSTAGLEAFAPILEFCQSSVNWQWGLLRVWPGGAGGGLPTWLGGPGPLQEEGLLSPANPESLALSPSHQHEAAESSKLSIQSSFARKAPFCFTWFCELGLSFLISLGVIIPTPQKFLTCFETIMRWRI